MAFAARYAEVVFSAQQGMKAAKYYYDELKALAVGAGRDPDSIKILLGVSPVMGDSPAAASERKRSLAGLLNAEYARQLVSFQLGGADLTPYGLDETIHLEALPEPSGINRRKGRFDLYRGLIEEGRTLRDLIEIEATAAGLQVAAGDPRTVAEELIGYFEGGAADGFVLIPPSQRVDGRRLLSEVIPLLQDKGYVRRSYNGSTLREHLDLPDPGARR